MLNFSKYHGLGNDFVLVDNRDGRVEAAPKLAEEVCHRLFGIGADGLMLAEKSSIADIRMIIYNSDGSRAGMCGNGLRCFARYAYERLGIRKDSITVETDTGILTAGIITKDSCVEAVRVNMGRPIFDNELIPCTVEENPIVGYTINVGGQSYSITTMLMGVPHTVIFTDVLDDEAVMANGKAIEKYEIFPGKTNVNFVKIISDKEIILRTWERGAGYTYACGTGACASVVAGVMNGLLQDNVLVHLRGGDLSISWKDREEVFMEGAAVAVFEGVYNKY